MYIKQVIIEGFKSYKDQIIAEPFSEKLNAIVGANGSGKSNFFHAIRFVLDAAFTTSRPEERRRLLHEGAGKAVKTAYVEVVFDNSDNRLQVSGPERSEVRLRRVIGLNEDKFLLDKRHITKREVTTMLESAGFSRANPYYVVQQGKIMSMTTMKDTERLELLKEIGGTNVYEQRREESLSIMVDTEQRKSHILESIADIERRMQELDAEKDELDKFQNLTRKRKSIQYTIYNKELEDVKSQLQNLEGERERVTAEARSIAEEMAEARASLADVERTCDALKQQEGTLRKQHNKAVSARTAAHKAAARIEAQVTAMEQAAGRAAEAKDFALKAIRGLDGEVDRKRQELTEARTDLTAQREIDARIAQNIQEASASRDALHRKQAAGTRFRTQAERDAWLQQEIAELRQTLAKRSKNLEANQAQVASDKEALNSIAKEISDQEAFIFGANERDITVTSSIAELKRKRDAAHNVRRGLQRTDDEATVTLQKLRSEERAAKDAMNRAVARDIDRAQRLVQRIVADHRVEGVYGSVIELFECDQRFSTAVEVTAGNTLFQIVVEDDDVATCVLGHMRSAREQSGRVTFMPLNRLDAKEPQYPTRWGKDVLPLLKYLKFNEKFRPAMTQIFSKTVICKDMHIAQEVANEAHFDCVTLQGDKVSRKGTMQGGYYDPRRNRVEIMKRIKEHASAIITTTGELERVSNELADLDRELGQMTVQINHASNTREHDGEQLTAAREEVRATRRRQADMERALGLKEAALKDAELAMRNLDTQIKGYEKELGTPMTNHLSASETADLARLSSELKDLEQQQLDCAAAVLDAEGRVSMLESMLNENLCKQREELQATVEASDSAAGVADVEGGKQEHAAAQEELAAARKTEADREAALADAHSQLIIQEKERERLRELLGQDTETRLDEDSELARIRTKVEGMEARCRELEAATRDLGSLPADAYSDKYAQTALKTLQRELKRTQSALDAMGSVNQKALDQFVNFTEQREEFVMRQGEMNRAEAKIRDMIDALDARKEEAIERTFKGVARNFREIFAALAPTGRGELVMQKAAAPAEAESDSQQPMSVRMRGGALSRYTGVKVKVSFGGSETMSMKQLSGGQKTLVALALIFAIQRCDPAPFYLFDEIDAALDPQYRTTVAEMLHAQSHDQDNPSQFIVTTFHPQIVNMSDKIYGVAHTNRISSIEVVPAEDALEFLQSNDEDAQES